MGVCLVEGDVTHVADGVPTFSSAGAPCPSRSAATPKLWTAKC